MTSTPTSTTPDQTSTPRPVVDRIRAHGSMADRALVTARVTYPGEAPTLVGFEGPANPDASGPVVMVSRATGPGGVLVVDPARHGPFGVGWVRRYWTERGSGAQVS